MVFFFFFQLVLFSFFPVLVEEEKLLSAELVSHPRGSTEKSKKRNLLEISLSNVKMTNMNPAAFARKRCAHSLHPMFASDCISPLGGHLTTFFPTCRPSQLIEMAGDRAGDTDGVGAGATLPLTLSAEEQALPLVSMDWWCGCSGRAAVPLANSDECAECGVKVAGRLGNAAPKSLKWTALGASAAAGIMAAPALYPVCVAGGTVAGALTVGGWCAAIGRNGGSAGGDDPNATDYSIPAGAFGGVVGSVAGGAAGGVASVVALPVATAAVVDVSASYVPRHHCRACGQSLCHTCLGDNARALSKQCNSRHKVCNRCCDDSANWRLRDCDESAGTGDDTLRAVEKWNLLADQPTDEARDLLGG
jgi:hypothetical protein